MLGRGMGAEVHGELLFSNSQHQHRTIYTMGRLGVYSGALYCDED